MNAIHYIGGEKGGVGKSIVSRLVSQYLIDKNITFQAFDADQSNGSLKRFYAQCSEGIDLFDFESIDTIVESVLETSRLAVVDLPAQSSKPLTKWFAENDIAEFLEETGLELYFWHVLDSSKDSCDLLAKLLQSVSGNVRFVVVKNHVHGSDFSWFEQSESARMLEQREGLILDLAELHNPTMSKIDKRDASFWAAVNNRGNDLSLRIMERQRVRIWMKKFYQQLDAASLFVQPEVIEMELPA